MDAVEYEYTIKRSDLTSDNVALLSLNHELYSQIEIDNSIGARAVIFRTHLNSIELAGNLEISGLELQFLEFTAFNLANHLVDVKFHDFVFKGVKEIKVNSDTLTILRGEASGFDLESINILVDKLDVRNAFIVNTSKSANFNKLYATTLSCETTNLILGNSSIKEIRANVSDTALIPIGLKLEIGNFSLNSAKFTNSGEIIANNININATDFENLNLLSVNGKFQLYGQNSQFSGKLVAQSGIWLTSSNFTNVMGEILSNQDFYFNGKTLELSNNNATIKGLLIDISANLIMGKGASIIGFDLENDGQKTKGQGVKITGSVYPKALRSAFAQNSSVIESSGDITLSNGGYLLSGKVIAAGNLNVINASKIQFLINSDVNIGADVVLEATKATFNGKRFTANNYDLTSVAQVKINNPIIGRGNLNWSNQDFYSKAKISMQGNITLSGHVELAGELLSDDGTVILNIDSINSLDTQSFTVKSEISGKYGVELRSTHGIVLSTNSSIKSSNSYIQVTSLWLDIQSQGLIAALQYINITTNGYFASNISFENAGKIESHKSYIYVSCLENVVNKGIIFSWDYNSIIGAKNIDNFGQIIQDQSTELNHSSVFKASEQLNNNGQIVLYSMVATANNITLATDSQISLAHKLSLNTKSLYAHGIIEIKENFNFNNILSADTSFNTVSSTKILSGKNITINLGAGTINGIIKAANSVDIKFSGNAVVNAEIQANSGNILCNATGSIAINNKIIAKEALSIVATDKIYIKNDVDIYSENSYVELKSNKGVANHGKLTGNSVVLRADDYFINYGTIIAKINAFSFEENEGRIAQKFENYGRIDANGVRINIERSVFVIYENSEIISQRNIELFNKQNDIRILGKLQASGKIIVQAVAGHIVFEQTSGAISTDLHLKADIIHFDGIADISNSIKLELDFEVNPTLQGLIGKSEYENKADEIKAKKYITTLEYINDASKFPFLKGSVKANSISIDSKVAGFILDAKIIAIVELNLSGQFANLGTINSATLTVKNGDFYNDKIIIAKGLASFERSLHLKSYSITSVGYINIGSAENKADSVECRGCDFIAISDSATSHIYAKQFLLGPKEFSKGPELIDEGPKYARCNNDHIARDCNIGSPGFKMGPSNIKIHNPNCRVEEAGRFVLKNNLNLYLDSFAVAQGLLDVGGTLHFEHKPSLSIMMPDCAKYSTLSRYFIGAPNFNSIIKERGIQNYRTEEVECHQWHRHRLCTDKLIDTDINIAFKSIIYALHITGSLSKLDLGILDHYNSANNMARLPAGSNSFNGLVRSDSLAAYRPNEIATINGALVPHIERVNLKIQLTTDYGNGNIIVSTINPQEFFKSSGLDINLMMNFNQFGSRAPYNLDPMPSNAMIASTPENGYTLHYYIKLDADMDPNFDPKVFLEELCFTGKGVIYTTDGHYTEKLIKDAVFITIGRISGYDQTKLINILAGNAHKTWLDTKITPGDPLNSWQIGELESPIIWPVWSSICANIVARCLSYELYYNQESINNFLYGANLLADEGIDLRIDGNFISSHLAKIAAKKGKINLQIGGHAVILGSLNLESEQTKLDVTGNFIAIGNIKSTEDLTLKALNVAIAGEVKAQKNLKIEAIQQLVLATLKSVSEIGGYGYYSKTSQIKSGTKISAGGELDISSQDDLSIIGAHVVGQEVYIKSANGKVQIVPVELYQKTIHSGYRYYYEYQALNFYQAKIESLSPGDQNIEDGVVRLSKEVAKNGGAVGIIIEAGSGILLSGVNVNTDKKLKLISPNEDIKIETPNEYKSMVCSYTKSRGGAAGFFGGKKTVTIREESSTPLYSRIWASMVEFVSPKNIEIGADIITYAVDFDRTGATKDAKISIIPKISSYSYEIKTKKTGLLFEVSSSGNFMFAGSKTKTEKTASMEIMPTIIQIGGISEDTNDKPYFIAYTKGSFVMLSSRIEEYRDSKGNFIDGTRKSRIIIEADTIELESVPDSKFEFAVLDEVGTGIGFNANSGEVALKAGVFAHRQESATLSTTHNNPPGFLSQFLQLKTNSLKDVAAIYNAEQMDIHAKIIFHGVAKDSVTKTNLDRLMEAGVKLGIKFGSLGRMVDASSRAIDQDLNTPEGVINGGFAAFQAYHEALKLMSGNGVMSGGAWAFAQYEETRSKSTMTREIPTVIKVGNLTIDTDDWELIGTQIEAYRGYIKAKTLKTRAAEIRSDSSSSTKSFDVEIPLTSGAPIGISAGISGSKGTDRLMMNARIHIHEDLRLEVSGHADMEGITVSAKSLEGFFNSLTLASVQDISKHNSWGANIGFSSTDISSIGGQIGSSDKHIVRELTSILGTEKCLIVVANALRLNFAMIAAAHRAEDGSYSDHGALTLRVGELFVQHIHDYDKGYTLGAAISSSAFMPTVGGRDGEGETFATIGKGNVECTAGGDGVCEVNQANRDVARPQSWTQHYDVDPITAYIPLEPLPDLPKTKDGAIDWNQVGNNLEGQASQVLSGLSQVFFAKVEVQEQTLENLSPDEENKNENGEQKEKALEDQKTEENQAARTTQKISQSSIQAVLEAKKDSLKKELIEKHGLTPKEADFAVLQAIRDAMKTADYQLKHNGLTPIFAPALACANPACVGAIMTFSALVVESIVIYTKTYYYKVENDQGETIWLKKPADSSSSQQKQNKQKSADTYGTPPDPNNWEPDDFEPEDKKTQNKDLSSQQKVQNVIKETRNSNSNSFTSRYVLTEDEAMNSGVRWLGKGYKEIGNPGSGVYRSADGLRQFRIDKNSLLGNHNPYKPHIHLEKIDLTSGKAFGTNHILIKR